MSNSPGLAPKRLTASWFRTPTRGSSSRIQPSVVDNVGKKNESQNMNSSPRAHGTLVLANSQASRMPIGNDSAWYQNATSSVFHNDWRTPGLLQASTQGWTPYTGGAPMRAVLKLLRRMRNSG